ncbi:hypothetical protein AB0M54_36915 [Actinoplanes sp. NPDC051470]|uniref:hypothetical protein n=1 Tax=Actinoplanes sp. NPDC051470 TaxID=3157224 RepID=UPI00344A1DFF
MAAPAERILSGLPTRITRARRRRRIGAAAGSGLVAAAVAAAIAIPSLVVGPDHTAVGPPPGSTADVPVFYRPGRMPDGFTERSRRYSLDPDGPDGWSVVQRWEKPAATRARARPSVELQIWPAPRDTANLLGAAGEPVDIDGAPGRYARSGDGTTSQVSWSPRAGVVLKMTAVDVDVARDVLLGTARSVKPDRDTLNPPIRVRSLPEGWLVTGAVITASTYPRWTAQLNLLKRPQRAGGPVLGLTIAVSAKNLRPVGAWNETVAGKPARFLGKQSTLEVDLGEGVMLSLSVSGVAADRALLVEMAENVEVTGTGGGLAGRPVNGRPAGPRSARRRPPGAGPGDVVEVQDQDTDAMV